MDVIDYLLKFSIENTAILFFSVSLLFAVSGRVRLEYLFGDNYHSLPVRRLDRTKWNIIMLVFFGVCFIATLLTAVYRLQVMFLLFLMLEYFRRGVSSITDQYGPTMYFNKKGLVLAPPMIPLVFSRFVGWENIQSVEYLPLNHHYMIMSVFVKNRKRPVRLRIYASLKQSYDEAFAINIL